MKASEKFQKREGKAIDCVAFVRQGRQQRAEVVIELHEFGGNGFGGGRDGRIYLNANEAHELGIKLIEAAKREIDMKLRFAESCAAA